jgi:hypothetical protein
MTTTSTTTTLISFAPVLNTAAAAVIDAIRPDEESLARRNGVQEYVRQLIARCFHPEQVGEWHNSG